MKKISFIMLCFLMLFLGFNVYASSNNEIEYEEYTGQAVSDDYKTEDDGVFTYGAITVDPGLGGNSDDEFEMNDSFQTATDITKLISYNGNIGNFTKYLSIANHSNGSVDKDFFYFDNQYLCKTFSVSITTDSFVKYNLQLYSVQGNEYVLVKSSDSEIAFTNFECGSFVLRLVFTNNTQASYKISINSEKTEYKANQAEVSATSLYDGLTKKFNVQSRNLYFKFYPNKSGQFTLDYDLNYIDSVEIYEYVTYNNFVNGIRKKLYNLENDKTEVNLFQANMSANRKLNPNSTTGYYVHLTAKKRGETSFKIKYSGINFVYNTNVYGNNVDEYLFPMDDLSIFTSIYSKGDIETKEHAIIKYDVLTKDFLSGNSDYDNVYGGINIESMVEKEQFNEDDLKNGNQHITIYRYALIDYIYDDNSNDVEQSTVYYMRFAVIENSDSNTSNIVVSILMNYRIEYVYSSNLMYFNSCEEKCFMLTDFSALVESYNGSCISEANIYNQNKSSKYEMKDKVLSGITQNVADKLVETATSWNKPLNITYKVIKMGTKIAYAFESNNANADVQTFLDQNANGAFKCKYISSNAYLFNNRILEYKNSPYFPTYSNETNNNDFVKLYIKAYQNNNFLNKDYSYTLSFNVKIQYEEVTTINHIITRN